MARAAARGRAKLKMGLGLHCLKQAPTTFPSLDLLLMTCSLCPLPICCQRPRKHATPAAPRLPRLRKSSKAHGLLDYATVDHAEGYMVQAAAAAGGAPRHQAPRWLTWLTWLMESHQPSGRTARRHCRVSAQQTGVPTRGTSSTKISPVGHRRRLWPLPLTATVTVKLAAA